MFAVCLSVCVIPSQFLGRCPTTGVRLLLTKVIANFTSSVVTLIPFYRNSQSDSLSGQVVSGSQVSCGHRCAPGPTVTLSNRRKRHVQAHSQEYWPLSSQSSEVLLSPLLRSPSHFPGEVCATNTSHRGAFPRFAFISQKKGFLTFECCKGRVTYPSASGSAPFAMRRDLWILPRSIAVLIQTYATLLTPRSLRQKKNN